MSGSKFYPIWPYTTTLVANQVRVVPDWTIAPPPADDKFTVLAANSPTDQIIRDARYPGLEIKIPACTTIIGWDGVAKSRLAVERLEADKPLVSSPPLYTRWVYRVAGFGGAIGTALPATNFQSLYFSAPSKARSRGLNPAVMKGLSSERL